MRFYFFLFFFITIPLNLSANESQLVPIFDVETGETKEVSKVIQSEEAWREQLDKDQYRILREKGTEWAFTGKYWKNKKNGLYKCAACQTDLYHSEAKFKSGTGWPSFTEPVAETNLAYEEDLTFGMRRVEVKCARCDSHLGHVFEDGPAPTYKRHCINSAALTFVEK